MGKIDNLYYVRFQQPIPTAENKEPVSEFVLSGKQIKYVVDWMTCDDHWLRWECCGEKDKTPAANIMYCRIKKD